MGRVRAWRRTASWRVGLCASEVLVGPEQLYPEEEQLVAGASPARRAEFATGRHCARTALADLGTGFPDAPLLRDEHGAPVWPAGVVGSITHCAGWTGAVAARGAGPGRGRRSTGIRGIGIDAEPCTGLPGGVLGLVASGRERSNLTGLASEEPGIPWDTVLFSAKEAAYKAWYPLTGLVVGHRAVEVELSTSGGFTAVVQGAGAEHRVRGRWRLGPAVVVTIGVVA